MAAPAQVPGRTCYEASTPAPPAHAPLRGSTSCDVCVAGGGIAGSSAALHLAERGYQVVLLEEHRIGWGASGRNGGQVLPGIAASQDTLERLIGASDARKAWDLSVQGANLVRELIERHAIDCEFASGHMLAAVKPRHDTELRALESRLRERYGYDSARYMSPAEVRAVLQTGHYRGALYDAAAGHLQPLKYTRGLAAAALQRGARIFESTRALDFHDDSIVCVRTAAGEVRCRHLVLCGNAHLGATAQALQRKIMVVGSCIIATEPLAPERARRLITNNAAVADTNWVLDYFRRCADDRLLFGGRVTYAGFDPDRIAATTRRRMLKVFPQLADVRIQFAWGGRLDITRNRAPDFGRLSPRVYFLQGFSGHGIALASIAGRLVAEAIAGQAESFDVFARIPHRNFPGGALLRRPALVLAMLYYRLKDLL